MVTVEDVKAFANGCVFLRSVYEHSRVLFDSGERRRELLERTAHTFFHDLNWIMNEYIVLQFCKLTDPEGKPDRKNLTVNFLINNSDFSDSPTKPPS